MINVKNISKKFGEIMALNDISFTAESGEIICLLGPNGAGKTTLMRIICGYLQPDKGRVLIANQDINDDLPKALAKIGYMPENITLYGDMAVFEYLQFVAKIHKVKKEVFMQRLQNLATKLEIVDVLKQKIETLSKGYKRRVALASVLLHQPKILILDEPTEGLDPNQKVMMRGFLQEYAKQNLVIISTHILEEAEAISSRIIIVNKGKIIHDSNVSQLKLLSKSGNLQEVFYNLTKG